MGGSGGLFLDPLPLPARPTQHRRKSTAMEQQHYTPRGWTEEHCPKGHLREEFAYLTGGAMRCRQCDRDNRARQEIAKSDGGVSLDVTPVRLRCGDIVYYRRGMFAPNEPLWCGRHEDWIYQGLAA